MIKRMMLLGVMALAAIAYAAPAAQAEVTLTDPEGVKLEEGAKVTLTSTNLVTTFNEVTTLHCAKVTLHFELLDTGPEHLRLLQLGDSTNEGCTYQDPEKSFPATITEGTAGVGEGEEGVVTVDTWGTIKTHVTFTSTLYADAGHTIPISHCHFRTTDEDGKAHIDTVGATGVTDKLSLTPALLTKTPEEASCSAAGAVLEGDFTIETSNGEEITIDYSDTT